MPLQYLRAIQSYDNLFFFFLKFEVKLSKLECLRHCIFIAFLVQNLETFNFLLINFERSLILLPCEEPKKKTIFRKLLTLPS